MTLENYNFAFDFTQFRNGKPVTHGSGDGQVQTGLSGSATTSGFVTNKKFRTKYKFVLQNEENRCVVTGVIPSKDPK